MSPEARNYCDVCSKDATEQNPVVRCSRCKNQWYCGGVCQKMDWYDHKYNCSYLPPEPLPTFVLDESPEFKEDLEERMRLLKGFEEAWNKLGENENKKLTGSQVAALPTVKAILDYDEESSFRYDPGNLRVGPRTLAIISTTRLLLMSLMVDGGPPELTSSLEKWQLPSSEVIPYGAKIEAIPDKLSIGEYSTLLLLIGPMLVMYGVKEPAYNQIIDKWHCLTLFQKITRQNPTTNLSLQGGPERWWW